MTTPSSPPPAKPKRPPQTFLALSIMLIAVGGVWIGQGMGLIRGRSFMFGDPTWIWFGAAVLVVGVALLVRGLRIRRGG
jgi:hypothetical protein